MFLSGRRLRSWRKQSMDHPQLAGREELRPRLRGLDVVKVSYAKAG